MTLTTDALFTCQSRRVARTLAAAQRDPVHRYLFAHALDNDPAEKANGAMHPVEHPFLFGWRGKYRPSETDLAIQRQLIGYWSRMARTGNPNGGEDPTWPAHAPGSDPYLEIGATTMARTGPSVRRDFWDTVRLPWPHR